MKQDVIDSGMCKKTIACQDARTAKHHTPLPQHNVDKRRPRGRLQKRAFILHRPEPPLNAINIGPRGCGGGTDDDTACDASVYFAHTGLPNIAKGKTLRPTDRL